MARPQQQDLARSGHNALEPTGPPPGQPTPGPQGSGTDGPVPEENRPGHHPDHDQDKPDLGDFAERLGIEEPDAPPGGVDLRTVALIGAGAAVAVGLAVTTVHLLRRRSGQVVDVAHRATDLVGDLTAGAIEHTPFAEPPLHRAVADRTGDLVGDLVDGLADRARSLQR